MKQRKDLEGERTARQYLAPKWALNQEGRRGRLRPKAEDNAEARSARRSENGQIEGQKTRK